MLKQNQIAMFQWKQTVLQAVCIKWPKLALGAVNVQQADQKLRGQDNKPEQQFSEPFTWKQK